MSTVRHLVYQCIALSLLSGAAMLGSTDVAAADVGVAVSMSPDAARVIRDWRRAHGLPQPPEADEVQAPARVESIPAAIHMQPGNAGGDSAAARPSRARPQPSANAQHVAGDI
jgi:hypothetical protein